MTLIDIVTLLQTSGIDSKHKVIDLLCTDNIKELYEFRRSITQRITSLKIVEEEQKKFEDDFEKELVNYET